MMHRPRPCAPDRRWVQDRVRDARGEKGSIMPRTIPCLWFDGDAEDAANYYVSVFPNSRIGAIARYPEDNPFPPNFPAGTALTVEFELDGQPYVGLNGGPEFTFSEAISFQIMCADQKEIDRYWDELTSDGG